VQRIEAGEVAPAPIPLVALLAACAQMSIEDMVETDLLREAWSTADDITSRLRYVLNEQKAWWTST
jgi:hypothetical protein